MLDTPTNLATIVIVAGVGKHDQAIGNKNQLLWHVPVDLKRFKALTLGHPIIMGSKTFESIIDILGKPFPGRTNIVMAFDKDFKYEGVKIAHSIEEALTFAQAEDPTEIHIGGGAEIYRQFLPLTSKLFITWFDGKKEADTFFPEFEADFEVTKTHSIQKHEDLEFQWIDYIRK